MLYFALCSVSVVGNWKEEQTRSLETWIIIMALPLSDSVNTRGLWFLQQFRTRLFLRS